MKLQRALALPLETRKMECKICILEINAFVEILPVVLEFFDIYCLNHDCCFEV